MAGNRDGRRPPSQRAAVLAATLLTSTAIFVWLLQRVASGGTRAVDAAILAWVESGRTPGLTAIAVNLTALGSSTLLTVLTSLVVAVLWTSGRRIAAFETALASSLAGLLTRTIKLALVRERPPLLSHLVAVSGYSFPSGHASGVAALLTAVTLVSVEAATSRTQRVVVLVFYILLLLGVGGSRVYLGVHHPSDVVAGLCLGIACALVAHALSHSRQVIRRLRTRRSSSA